MPKHNLRQCLLERQLDDYRPNRLPITNPKHPSLAFPPGVRQQAGEAGDQKKPSALGSGAALVVKRTLSHMDWPAPDGCVHHHEEVVTCPT